MDSLSIEQIGAIIASAVTAILAAIGWLIKSTARIGSDGGKDERIEWMRLIESRDEEIRRLTAERDAAVRRELEALRMLYREHDD